MTLLAPGKPIGQLLYTVLWSPIRDKVDRVPRGRAHSGVEAHVLLLKKRKRRVRCYMIPAAGGSKPVTNVTSTVEKLMLRPTEAAEAIGLGRSTVYAMIASGELPSVRVGAGGRSVRIPVEALREWINAQVQSSSGERSE